MASKSCAISESNIFQITIAHLANNDKPVCDNDALELNDVLMSFDLFKCVFFENNYDTFQINNQYHDLDALLIGNKTIKSSNFRCYKNGVKFNLMDIMHYKHIKDKKTRCCDVSHLGLAKELSLHTSLVNFHVYHNSLSFDNVLAVYNHHVNKKSKNYFRFKIKVSYYSADLDTTLSVYFNYLVKIPKNINVCQQVIEEEPECDYENIVYSNYNKHISSNVTNTLSNITMNSSNNLEDDDSASISSDVSYEENVLSEVNKVNDTFF